MADEKGVAKKESTIQRMCSELDKIENIAREFGIANQTGTFRDALRTAQGIHELKEAITPEIMVLFRRLHESALGYLTDEKASGKTYSSDELKSVYIEAFLRGARLTNNEVNIISGRAYLAKNFFTRALQEKVSGLLIKKYLPKMGDAGKDGVVRKATIEYEARWNFNGKDMMLKGEIPVRLNKGMGEDAALGKADRKIKAEILSLITGTTFSDGEITDMDNMKETAIEVKNPFGSVKPKTKNGGSGKAENDLPPSQAPAVESSVGEAGATNHSPTSSPSSPPPPDGLLPESRDERIIVINRLLDRFADANGLTGSVQEKRRDVIAAASREIYDMEYTGGLESFLDQPDEDADLKKIFDWLMKEAE